MSHSEGNAKGRTVTLHIVSGPDGFIAKKDNGSPGWRVLEASTKPVLEQRRRATVSTKLGISAESPSASRNLRIAAFKP